MTPVGPDVFEEFIGFPFIERASVRRRTIVSEMSIIPGGWVEKEKVFEGYTSPTSCDRISEEPTLVIPKNFLYEMV
jgi:hypothetical protein